jgi:hypothetical protein
VPAVEITGNAKAVMQYVNYEEAIVQRYGVILEGWTYDRFVNPSKLSTALPPLQKLLDAINGGSCKFIKLSWEQRKAREKAHRAKVVSGEVQICERKTRKDAGKKRKSKKGGGSNGGGDSDDDSSSNSDDEARRKRRRLIKSAPIVEASGDEDDSA